MAVVLWARKSFKTVCAMVDSVQALFLRCSCSVRRSTLLAQAISAFVNVLLLAVEMKAAAMKTNSRFNYVALDRKTGSFVPRTDQRSSTVSELTFASNGVMTSVFID